MDNVLLIAGHIQVAADDQGRCERESALQKCTQPLEPLELVLVRLGADDLAVGHVHRDDVDGTDLRGQEAGLQVFKAVVHAPCWHGHQHQCRMTAYEEEALEQG